MVDGLLRTARTAISNSEGHARARCGTGSVYLIGNLTELLRSGPLDRCSVAGGAAATPIPRSSRAYASDRAAGAVRGRHLARPACAVDPPHRRAWHDPRAARAVVGRGAAPGIGRRRDGLLRLAASPPALPRMYSEQGGPS